MDCLWYTDDEHVQKVMLDTASMLTWANVRLDVFGTNGNAVPCVRSPYRVYRTKNGAFQSFLEFAGDGLTSPLIVNADMTLEYSSPALGSGTYCMRWRPVKAPLRSFDSPFIASVVRRCPMDVEAMSSHIFPNGVA